MTLTWFWWEREWPIALYLNCYGSHSVMMCSVLSHHQVFHSNYSNNTHLFQPPHTPYHQPVYPLQALHLVSHCALYPLSSILFFVVLTDQNERKISSLSTAEAVVTTAVVCVVCSFTAGLLLGVVLTQCHGHCHRKQKRGQTEILPVYEDITLEKIQPPGIKLQSNEAYGPIRR